MSAPPMYSSPSGLAAPMPMRPSKSRNTPATRQNVFELATLVTAARPPMPIATWTRLWSRLTWKTTRITWLKKPRIPPARYIAPKASTTICTMDLLLIGLQADLTVRRLDARRGVAVQFGQVDGDVPERSAQAGL